MKKLLIIILILISVQSFGQFTKFYTYNEYLGAWGDSVTNIANRDTAVNPYKIGETRFRIADSTVYIAISTSADNKWMKLRGYVPSGTGTGTVQSVGASIDGSVISVSGSPVTGTGTLAFNWNGAATDMVFGNGSYSPFSTSVTAITDPLYSPIGHSHIASDIINLTTYVRNLFSAGSGLVYNPTLGQYSYPGDSAGINSLNGLTDAIQYLDIDTTFNGPAGWSSVGTTHTLRLPARLFDGSGGGGNPNSNIGSGYRFAVPGTNDIKTLFNGYAIGIDSTSNTNALTLKADTSLLLTKLMAAATYQPAGSYLTPADTTGKWIWNQSASTQTANFNISGTGLAGLGFRVKNGGNIIWEGADHSYSRTGIWYIDDDILDFRAFNYFQWRAGGSTIGMQLDNTALTVYSPLAMPLPNKNYSSGGWDKVAVLNNTTNFLEFISKDSLGGSGSGGSGYAVSNEANNRVITSTGAGTANAESDLTFDAGVLTLGTVGDKINLGGIDLGGQLNVVGDSYVSGALVNPSNSFVIYSAGGSGITLGTNSSSRSIMISPNGVNVFTADYDAIKLLEVAAPSTPATGYGALYPKTDGKLYWKNDAGTEYDLTGGGGALADGDYGDVTVSGSGTTMTIDNLAVTNAKINDVAWSKISSVPSTLVKTDQANSFTAGMKQTVTADATNSGFKFGGVTANPSSLSAGDMWFRSDVGKLTYYDGGTAQSVVSENSVQTLVNKTINWTNNTMSLSLAQLNASMVSGGPVASTAGVETLTNKRITKRTGTTASSATPTINTDNVDFYSITALAANITSFTTNLSGSPTEGQTLWIAITDNGTPRTLAFGTSFEASTVPLPTTTVASTRLDCLFVWNSVTSKWRIIACQ